MALISEFFNLSKTQLELDFANVELNGDTPLFIDPFALSRRKNIWCADTHATLTDFFQRVVDAIRAGNDVSAMELLSYLNEPNETRFGLSRGRSQGAGIGRFQAGALFNALKSSSAIKTGLLESLEECELMIDGISWDKISDLTTNAIRGHLVDYTKEQCSLHGIPCSNVALAPCYDRSSGTWNEGYRNLPLADNRPILLVPKIIARYRACYQAGRYYNNFVLNFLQTQSIANTNLVRTFRGDQRIYTKKSLKSVFPYSKRFLFEFSQEHPEILVRYKESLVELEKRGVDETAGEEDQVTIALALIDALQGIPAGRTDSTEYQNLMLGILEFLFFPSLICPKKEHEVDDGRKRIDIVFSNDAESGIFRWIARSLQLGCAYLVFECKNYRSDVANQELDQLLGRFAPDRQVGFVCCRTFENPDLFMNRCKDAFKNRRGLAVPFEDQFVIQLLQLVAAGSRGAVEEFVRARIDSICFS